MNETSLPDITNPRTISKQVDQEGRDQRAKDILDARAKKREVSDNITDVEQTIARLSELTSQSYTLERQKEKELADRTQKLITRLKQRIGLGDRQVSELNSEIGQIQQERTELWQKTKELENQLKAFRTEQVDIPEPRDLLDAYYEKIASTPLTQEQKRELLQAEALSQLSMEQYVALWKRLNPHFLSHVTRQGFRDHNAMIYHSAGLQEFHAGFQGVMSDERLLRPPMALGALKNRDEASVREWLGDWVFEGDEEEAYDRLDRLMNFHLASAPKYPDKTAVHFAAQLVADDYYGGEHGNEVFFIYPSDVIASQHPFAFNGWEKDFTKPQSETKWNDVFVWTHTVENAGIPIDAGIVFLPKSTQVDRHTGSKYASELVSDEEGERRVMVEDQALIDSFVSWLSSLNEQSPVMVAFQQYDGERQYWTKQDLRDQTVQAIKAKLSELDFSDDSAASLAGKVFSDLHYRKSFNSELAESIIRETGAQYKRAKDAVTAEEYWEAYFEENPELRPKHVVYYDGDPSRAVLEFQRKHGIGQADTSEQEGQLLGFDDHHVTDMQSDERSNAGKQELYEAAKQIIADHYKEKEDERLPQ